MLFLTHLMVNKKKLYLVKRDVWAHSIKAAMIGRGKIYEIMETDTPPEEKKQVGFKDNDKRKK